MTPIVRSKPGGARPRILVVRPTGGGIKSVRRSDEADRTPLRLAIGVVVALGIAASVWLVGHLGFRLGFAPLVDVPQLLGRPGGGLTAGTIMLISIPQVIILAGVAEPLWLMLGFAVIAIPAAGISAAKPRVRGGPPPSSVAVVFTHLGAIGAALNALVVIWWTVSGARNSRMGDLPLAPDDATAWLAGLQTAAGLDVLAVIASALWVVLVMRLAVPLWLRAITVTATLFTLVVAIVAMSMSNGAAALVQTPRSEVFFDDGSLDTRLVLGFTDGHLVTLRVDEGVSIVELHEKETMVTVYRGQSVVGMLEDAAAKGRSR